MPTVRINFAISEELFEWVRSHPNIDSIDRNAYSTIINHSMTPQEAQTMKSEFLDKLIEVI